MQVVLKEAVHGGALGLLAPGTVDVPDSLAFELVATKRATWPGSRPNAWPDPSAVSVAGNSPWRLAASKQFLGTRSFFSAVKQAMNYSVHKAHENISSVKIVDSNWTFSAGAESGSGANTIITASIEYPIGSTPQIVLFSGVASGTVLDGADLVSDELTLSTPIPRGALFAARVYRTNTAGIYLSGQQMAADGDKLLRGASGIADLTAGGVCTTSDTTYIAPPTGIITRHSGVAIGCVGDSRVQGTHDTDTTTTLKFRGELGRGLHPNFPFATFGASGETAAQFTAANAPRRIAFVNSYCSHVICQHGTNSFSTSAAMKTNVRAIWAIFQAQGKKVYQTTIPPTTTGAWTLADGSDQTPVAAAAELVLFNTFLRTMDEIDGVLDIASVVALAANEQKWKAPGYTDDGIHEVSFANVVIARSGQLDPGKFR